ncbi:uncharacterized protein LOC126903830 isoform X1 [Daktulosphaira vitifoliae]|uniref:uncharacterized protein LOC126903830 isoform X1 n=1 Tax=Daktulosphaira vitifoliae TaxID=58002 RepID=UPI0021A9FCF3|nr:uncharacterized protein LOC126903830 isoform X1 [Daktulosphaira vitifoliae]
MEMESKKKNLALQNTNSNLMQETANKDNLIKQLQTKLVIIINVTRYINFTIIILIMGYLTQKDGKNQVDELQQQLSNLNVDGQIKIEKNCTSWWCPKHSGLEKIINFLNPKTEEEKKCLRLAMNRRKYWVKDNEIKCCVHDRKSGSDKHTIPPKCIVEYKKLAHIDSTFEEMVMELGMSQTNVNEQKTYQRRQYSLSESSNDEQSAF